MWRSSKEAVSADRSRSERGLGPFTGGQLTVIILGITLAIAFPIGAWSVTGSNVFVADATSGKTAKVDANGNVLSKVSGTVNAVTRPADYSSAGAPLRWL